MRPPEAVAAAERVAGEAWELLRGGEGTSRVQAAWSARVLEVVTGREAQDAACEAAYQERQFGIRAGLLLGMALASRHDGSAVTAAEAAQALIDAAEWLDADAGPDAWPEDRAAQEEQLRGMVLPRATAEDQESTREVLEVLFAAHRAARVAAVGAATTAATDSGGALNGVDLVTCSLGQMLELDRSQQAAALEGRARLERILDERPEWSP